MLTRSDRVELIEGDFFERTPITPRHASVTNRLLKRLVLAVGEAAIVGPSRNRIGIESQHGRVRHQGIRVAEAGCAVAAAHETLQGTLIESEHALTQREQALETATQQLAEREQAAMARLQALEERLALAREQGARFDKDVPADDLGCGDATPSNPCAQPVAIIGLYVPNSPTNVIDAGITAQHPSGWFGALKARHFGESPLVEDNSARSPAYTTFDLQLGYQRTGKWLFAVDVFNLSGVKWNDIEYYYVSRLQNEASPKPDYVVHPGVPRTVRAHFQIAL